MNKRITLFFCGFVFLLVSAKAQSRYVLDSLNRCIQLSHSDTAKAMIYTKMADECAGRDDKNAKEYLSKAQEFAFKTNYKKALKYNRLVSAKILSSEKKEAKAIVILDSLLKNSDKHFKAELLLVKHDVLFSKKDKEGALKSLMEALKIAEANKYKDILCEVYYNLGNNYDANNSASKNHFDKAFLLAKETGNWRIEMHITHKMSHRNSMYNNTNLGGINNEVAYHNQLSNLNEVLGDAQKATDIAKKYQTEEEYEYTQCIARFYRDAGELKKAEELLDSRRNFFLKNKNKTDRMHYYISVGNIKKLLKKDDEALDNYYEALDIAEHEQNHDGLSSAAWGLSAVYDNKKNYTKAYEFARLGNSENLEVNSETNRNSHLYEELNAQYKSEQKQHEFELLEKDKALQGLLLNEQNIKLSMDSLEKGQRENYIKLLNKQKDYEQQQKEKKDVELKLNDEKINNQALEIKQKKRLGFAVTAGLLIALGAIVLVYRNYKLKKRDNLIITKQKQEVEIQKEQIEYKNKEITDSINYAKSLQESVLPELEFIEQNINCFVFYQPKDIIAGDFYFHYQINTNECIIAAGDCTGHGVPGALTSVICSQKLNEVIDRGMHNPAEILTEVNKEVKKTFRKKTNDGMDIALIKINTETRQVIFAGANRPLVAVLNNEITEYKGVKSAIGHSSLSDEAFTETEIVFEKDTMIYLFSDGYADQFGGEKNKKLSTKKLKELLQNCSGLELIKQKEFMKNALMAWQHGLDQIDDVLVIGIKV